MGHNKLKLPQISRTLAQMSLKLIVPNAVLFRMFVF